jgi:hypothetical protein
MAAESAGNGAHKASGKLDAERGTSIILATCVITEE